MGKPQPTIRLVWFGVEEPGFVGARGYAEAHGAEEHAFAAESDAGTGRVLSFETSVRQDALAALDPLRQALESMGVVRGGRNGQAEGSDITVMARKCVPVLQLTQDLTSISTSITRPIPWTKSIKRISGRMLPPGR